MCRSRRELSNAYVLAKFGFDTAENEPCQVSCPEIIFGCCQTAPLPRSAMQPAAQQAVHRPCFAICMIDLLSQRSEFEFYSLSVLQYHFSRFRWIFRVFILRFPVGDTRSEVRCQPEELRSQTASRSRRCADYSMHACAEVHSQHASKMFNFKFQLLSNLIDAVVFVCFKIIAEWSDILWRKIFVQRNSKYSDVFSVHPPWWTEKSASFKQESLKFEESNIKFQFKLTTCTSPTYFEIFSPSWSLSWCQSMFSKLCWSQLNVDKRYLKSWIVEIVSDF